MASPKRDRALLAEITGVARRLAGGRPVTGAEQQEAAATLSQVARGRADLLAESAGLAIGAHEATGTRHGTCGSPSSASTRAPTSARFRSGSRKAAAGRLVHHRSAPDAPTGARAGYVVTAS